MMQWWTCCCKQPKLQLFKALWMFWGWWVNGCKFTLVIMVQCKIKLAKQTVQGVHTQVHTQKVGANYLCLGNILLLIGNIFIQTWSNHKWQDLSSIQVIAIANSWLLFLLREATRSIIIPTSTFAKKDHGMTGLWLCMKKNQSPNQSLKRNKHRVCFTKTKIHLKLCVFNCGWQWQYYAMVQSCHSVITNMAPFFFNHGQKNMYEMATFSTNSACCSSQFAWMAKFGDQKIISQWLKPSTKHFQDVITVVTPCTDDWPNIILSCFPDNKEGNASFKIEMLMQSHTETVNSSPINSSSGTLCPQKYPSFYYP